MFLLQLSWFQGCILLVNFLWNLFVIWWKWEKLYWLRKQIASMTIDADAEEDNWGNKVSFEHSAHLLWNLDPFRWDNGRLVAISVVREVGEDSFVSVCFVTSLALLLCGNCKPNHIVPCFGFHENSVNNKPIWKDKPIFALKDPFFFLIKKPAFVIYYREPTYSTPTHTKWCQRVAWSTNGLCSYLWAKTPLPSCQTFKQRANFKSCKSNSIWPLQLTIKLAGLHYYRASLHYVRGPKDLQWNSAFLNSEYAKIQLYVCISLTKVISISGPKIAIVLSPIDICNINNRGDLKQSGVVWNQLGYMAINSGGRRDLWQNWWGSLEMNNMAWLITWGHVKFGFPTVFGTWVYSICFGESAAAAAVGSFGIFPKNAYLLQWSHNRRPNFFNSPVWWSKIFNCPGSIFFNFMKSF